MKLLIAGLNYAPDSIGIAKYTSEMCDWFVSMGHEVHVVSAPPYYPEWEVPDEYRAKWYRKEIRHGVHLLRVPIYVPKKPAGITRLLHLASFAMASLPVLFWKALVLRPDVVVAIAPALFAAPGARLAAAMCGAKSWLHIQDFEVDAAFELGFLKGRRLRTIALSFERWLLRSFSKVSTISPQMMSLLYEKGCELDRLCEVRNWVDLSAIRPEVGADAVTELNSYRAMLNLRSQDVLVLYAGNIGQKQGIEIMSSAARLLENRADVKFLIVGDGPGKADLMELANGLTNIHFLPLQATDRLNALLCAADIHVLPQRLGAADLVLPSKLTGMFASGRPVIVTAESGTGLSIEVEGRGIIVPPGDESALAQAITTLADDVGYRLKLGAAARRRSEEAFGHENILRNMESELLKMLA